MLDWTVLYSLQKTRHALLESDVEHSAVNSYDKRKNGRSTAISSLNMLCRPIRMPRRKSGNALNAQRRFLQDVKAGSGEPLGRPGPLRASWYEVGHSAVE